MEIIPAIMPQSFEDLHERVSSVRKYVESVQVDVMDGKFVPPVNWPYNKGDREVFEKIMEGDVALPFWREVSYEADLMILEPEKTLDEWVNAGFHRIIVHFESTKALGDILETWGGMVEIGVALNVDTKNEEIFPYVEAINFVQFMGIAQIGYQGMAFDKRVIDKVKSLRKAFPEVIISIDGGVSKVTALPLFKAGANRLAAGSAIFEANDIGTSIAELKQAAVEGKNEEE